MSGQSSPSRTAKSFAWSFLEQGGSRLIQMVVQIVLARLLAPEAFGVLAILLVVTQVADSVAQSGLGAALIQKPDADATSYTTAWWLSLALAAAMYAALFLTAPAVAAFYAMPQLESYLRVLGLVVLTNSANSIQRSHLQRSMDFRSIFRASTAAALLSGVVGVALALAGAGVWALVAQTLAQSLFTCVVMWVQVSWRPSLAFDRVQARELFGYGWKICVTGVLNVFYQGISELVLGSVCAAKDLGYYSNGRKYTNAVMGLVTNSLSNVMFPAFSKMKGDGALLRAAIRKSLLLGSFVLVPFCVLCALVAEPIVYVLLGEKWLPCVPVFQLACLGNVTTMMMLVNLRAYMALGDSARYMRINIIKVLLGGGAIWATAAVTHDIYATAFATFVVNIAGVLFVDSFSAKRVIGYGAAEQLRDQAPIFLLVAVSASVSLAVGLLNISYWVRFCIQVITFCVVYLGGARLLRFEQLEQASSLFINLVKGKG